MPIEAQATPGSCPIRRTIDFSTETLNVWRACDGAFKKDYGCLLRSLYSGKILAAIDRKRKKKSHGKIKLMEL